MDSPQGPPTLEVIPVDECWTLLTHHSVGRFAVAAPDESPLVVPVNYVVDDECIEFASDPGTKLTLLRTRPASLQIDWIDPYHRVGWSVLVQGRASEVEADEDAGAGIAPWVGARGHRVRLVPVTVTGRRIRLPDVRTDERGYL